MAYNPNQQQFLSYGERQQFETAKPAELQDADIWMISGCDDHQTSADVSNVASFQLPDPQGKAGGACTATLLNVLYEDEQTPHDDYTFTEVLMKMRTHLKKKGFKQIPQLSSAKPIDLNTPFKIVPDDLPGTRRAVLIGINYRGQKGELRGCHNDVFNLYNYIQDYYGFQDEDITVLADDGDHQLPTKRNILKAYNRIVEQSQPGDSIFLHYSGHGTKVKDLNGDEDDGYDEALCPLDMNQAGVILDDDLYELLVKGIRPGVHVVALMDCCHSGTVLDLPYIFKANGQMSQMEIDRGFNVTKLFGKFLGGGGNAQNLGKLMNGKMGKKLINQGTKILMGGGKMGGGGGGGGGKMVNGFMKQFLK